MVVGTLDETSRVCAEHPGEELSKEGNELDDEDLEGYKTQSDQYSGVLSVGRLLEPRLTYPTDDLTTPVDDHGNNDVKTEQEGEQMASVSQTVGGRGDT